jgi:hypothetical protein
MPDIQGMHSIRPRDQHPPRYFGPLKFIYRKKSDRATDGQLNHRYLHTRFGRYECVRALIHALPGDNLN